MNHRVIARLLAALLASTVALLSPLAAAPAHAGGEGGDVFRYWAYFHAEDDEYQSAQEGLGEFVPEDGDVEALRYAAPADFNNPNLPRADLAEVGFETVCADTEAGSGEKRVAVILDYGVEADSEGAEVPEPEAACAAVPEDANTLQTVQGVAELRTESSSFGPQLCAVEGYPASGCSAPADSATPPDDGTVEFAIAGQEPAEESTQEASEGSEDSGGSNLALYVGLGVVALVLVAGGLVLARRRA